MTRRRTIAVGAVAFALACAAVAGGSRAGVKDLVPLPEKVEVVDPTPRALGNVVRSEAPAPIPQLGAEEYRLDTTGETPRLWARTPAARFYALKTLEQLADPQDRVPAVRITDRPRFAFRGLLLDSARHVQSVAYLKRLITLMSDYKLNRLQWHLTDDVGWRVEIKRHPKLTEIGAWRGTGTGRYGGFYTQEQIRDLVKFAADHFVTIVPEIEMPGHAQAAVAAYPHISCRGESVPVLAKFIASDRPLCPSNPETYQFIDGVLDEVMELFPSTEIHVGGDECPRGPWKQCPRCQAFLKAHGLKDQDALQDEFEKHVAAYLRAKGRRMQGWNEVLHAGDALGRDVVIHQWNDAAVGAAAARAGFDVVVSQHPVLYFDFPYATTPLRNVYDFDPLPAGLTPAEAAHVLGPQACLWTEGRPSEQACDDYLWPRLLAVAEMGWTPQAARTWEDFDARLTGGGYARLARQLAEKRADVEALTKTLADRGAIGADGR